MKDIINALHKIASIYEKNGDSKEANHYHNLFLKFANEEDDDEFDDYDPENPPQELIRQVPVLFNSDTNQPIVHEGKYLAALPNDQDLPEIRGKVRGMTGIENMTIVHIPVNVLKVQYVHSDTDIKELDLMMDAFEAGVEDIGDFVYLLMLNENIVDVEGKDLVFSSESDAYAYGGVIANYYKSRGRDMEVSVAAAAVSVADTREPGMSLTDLYGDEEFIFVSNSSFQATKIPETIEDLNRELTILSQMRGYTVDRLQREKLGDYDYDVDYGDEDGNDRFSSTLEKLHKIASVLENNKLNQEAEIINDVFLRLAKKKAKKKNVPSDPALYSRCKSEVKKKFKVWPSAYGSAALVKLYKSRGGTYRS
jgi:hypothetical protein